MSGPAPTAARLTFPLLELRGIVKTFAGVQALKGVSLSLSPGEIRGLVGHNGAGKSTLIKVVSGALRPDDGQIVIEEKAFPALSPPLADRLGIAAVYQEQQLVPFLSAAENIWLAHEPRTLGILPDFKAMEEQTRTLAARYGLDVSPVAPVASLSFAQRQEVAILKAMVRHAKVVLLDEPTATLTGPQIDALFALLETLRAEGVGIIYISHRLEEVLRVSQRVSVLREGLLVATAASRDLTTEALVELMLGEVEGEGPRPEVTSAPEAPPAKGDILLSARDVRLPGARGGITLDVRRGEILGLTGTPDSGAREFGRVMAGILRPTSGTLLLHGKTYTPRSPADSVRQSVFFVPEDMLAEGLIRVLAIGRNIVLPIEHRLARAFVLNEPAERAIAADLVRALDIATPGIDQQVRRLSGGNQRKVLFAKAVAADPDLLILEEPAEGLDVRTRRELRRILGTLAAQGKAVVIISMDLGELFDVTHRILTMRGGAIIGEFDPRTATSTQILTDVLSAEAPS